MNYLPGKDALVEITDTMDVVFVVVVDHFLVQIKDRCIEDSTQSPLITCKSSFCSLKTLQIDNLCKFVQLLPLMTSLSIRFFT